MYCLYLRKSRADRELEAKGERETLARHRELLLDTARRLNLPVGVVYEEIESGETIEARPIAKQLLQEVEAGCWEGVLVAEIERLARGDTVDQGMVARAFKRGGAKIVTPQKIYDPENEFDEEYFEFGLFMSRREYKTINRRIQRGRRASVQEGKYVASTPPYGYDRVKICGDKGYTLAINDQEGPVVQLIFRLYAQGLSMDTIASRLDTAGITPRRGVHWSKSTLADILSNPVYKGQLRWGYRQERHLPDGKITAPCQKTTGRQPILAIGRHPALISDTAFDQAQQHRHAPRACISMLKNPLAGLMVCGLCGQKMLRQSPGKKTRYAVLRCPTPGCKNVSAPLDVVEKKLLRALALWLEDVHLPYQPPVFQGKTAVLDQTDQLFQSTRDALCQIDQQWHTACSLLERGIYTSELFALRNAHLSRQQQELTERLALLERAADSHPLHRERIRNKPHALGPLEHYDALPTAAEKNRLLLTLVARVEYIKLWANTKGRVENDNITLHLYPRLPRYGRL